MASTIYDAMCNSLMRELTDGRINEDLIPLTETQIEKIINSFSTEIKAAAELFFAEEGDNYENDWIVERCFVEGFTLCIGDDEFPFDPENFAVLVRSELTKHIGNILAPSFSRSQIDSFINTLPIDEAVNEYISAEIPLDEYCYINEDSICLNSTEYKLVTDPPLLFELCQSCVKQNGIDNSPLPGCLRE